MELFTVVVLLSSFLTVSLAAPRNDRLEERQRDKTFTITCLGVNCPDNPPTTLILPSTYTVPGGVPNSTPKTTPPKTTIVPTTKKTSTTIPRSTSRYTPPPPESTDEPEEPPPTKTVKSTLKSSQKPPTKTQTEEIGPSSTRCPVPLYYKCGGTNDHDPWTGCTKCVAGAVCVIQNEWYYQCVAEDSVLPGQVIVG